MIVDKGLCFAVVLLAAAASSVACVVPATEEAEESNSAAASAGTLRLPIHGDFPDPAVVTDGSRVHVYATNGYGRNIPRLVSSSSMASFSLAAQDALPRLGPWAEARFGCTWAPGVYRARNGSWVMFYSAQRKGHGNPNGGCGWMCIGRAVASSPEGPFSDTSGQPAACDTASNIGAWSLDPSPFVDDDGRAYLYWRQDSNGNKGGNIAVQALDDAGRPVGGRPILLSRDRNWELPVMENPRMARINGRYILFYSANDWEKSTYGVGYATCSGPMGPCTKQTTDGPWLSSLFTVHGIGGEEVFVGPNQVRYLAVHGYEEPKSDLARGGERKLWFYELHLDGAGRPALAAPPAPKPTKAPTAPSGCGVLRGGQGLTSGRTLASCNGRYALTMQTDGNLVLYRSGAGALWSSGTAGSDGYAFVMQGDGNAVLLGRYENPLWSSRTFGNAGATLVVQDDGNVVVYAASTPKWSSGTAGR